MLYPLSYEGETSGAQRAELCAGVYATGPAAPSTVAATSVEGPEQRGGTGQVEQRPIQLTHDVHPLAPALWWTRVPWQPKARGAPVGS